MTPRALVAAGFVTGAAFHAIDFWRYGWWPYRFGPPAANLFWNALLPLDLLVAAAVLLRPCTGMAAACVLIVGDVAVNLYAWQVLGFREFAGAMPVQAGFGAFVLWVARRQRCGGASTSG